MPPALQEDEAVGGDRSQMLGEENEGQHITKMDLWGLILLNVWYLVFRFSVSAFLHC